MVSIQICRWQNYNYSIGGREYIPTRLKTMVSCRKINLKQMCKMNLPIWYDAGGSHMLWYSVHVIRRPAGCSCTTCLVLAKLRLKCLLRRIFDSAAPLPPKKNAGRQSGGQRFARACAVEMHMDISEEQFNFAWKCTRKMPDPNPATHVLCEPAQSKCTWTFQKSHFVLKFTGKMPDAPETTWIKHRALTVTVRTPQCGHTVWGT